MAKTHKRSSGVPKCRFVTNEEAEAKMLETIVTREDVAETYENGLDNLLNYEKAVILSKDHSLRETARILGINRTTVRQWINGRKYDGENIEYVVPSCVRGVRYLEEKGFIPFDESNHYFREINILASWLMWSGCLTLSSNVVFSATLPKTQWNKSDGKMIVTVEECLKKIDVKFKYANDDALRALEQGPLSRFFECMGVPAGSKQNNLPDFAYLKKCSKKASYDFIRVLLATRMNGSSDRGYYINLITNRRKSRAEEHLNDVKGLMNSFFSEYAIKYCVKLRKDFNDGYYYLPKISFGNNEFKKIIAKYPDLLELTK